MELANLRMLLGGSLPGPATLCKHLACWRPSGRSDCIEQLTFCISLRCTTIVRRPQNSGQEVLLAVAAQLSRPPYASTSRLARVLHCRFMAMRAHSLHDVFSRCMPRRKPWQVSRIILEGRRYTDDCPNSQNSYCHVGLRVAILRRESVSFLLPYLLQLFIVSIWRCGTCG